MPADFDAILKNVEERLYRYPPRDFPLRKADDAITLDNSNMTISEQKAWLMEQYQKGNSRISYRKETAGLFNAKIR